MWDCLACKGVGRSRTIGERKKWGTEGDSHLSVGVGVIFKIANKGEHA
jgi:hypothetical protein